MLIRSVSAISPRQRGGALIDVMGAMAIGATALLLYKSTIPISDQDQASQQVAWMHKMQVDAVTQAVRAKQASLLSALIAPDSYAALSDAEWVKYLPLPVQTSPGNANNQSRLNAWQQKPCVLVRQVFGQNFQNQNVPTGFLEVVLAQTGGPSPIQADANAALNLALSSLQSTSTPAGYTAGDGDNIAPAYNPAKWFVPASTWTSWAQSSAGQGCNPVLSQWTHRIWAAWQIDPSGQRIIAPGNTEYLARYGVEGLNWIQEMDAPLWLSTRSPLAGSPNASIHNITSLVARNRGDNCNQSTEEGVLARSADTPPQLLQCKSNAGVYQWLDAGGMVASGTVLTNTLVLTRVEKENSDCTTQLTGTLARVKETGAPLACTGTASVRKWVRVGVPWAWVIDPKVLLNDPKIKSWEFNPDILNIPVSATMVQIYIEGSTPKNTSATIKLEEIDTVTNQVVSTSTVFEVPAFSEGPSILGRPRLIDRKENRKYKFTINNSNANMSINLLGYSY